MEAGENRSDIALMARVRQGDMASFEELHGRYQRKLLNFFFGLSHNPSTANDLCQETFLRLWKIRQRYRATGSFPGYLFAVARMVWLERCRAQARLQRLGLREPLDVETLQCARTEVTPCDCAERAELARSLQQALDQLPEEQRIVFVLRAVRGLSLEDIAETLDCPVNTVRSRKLLAVKKLRHLLAHVFGAAREDEHTREGERIREGERTREPVEPRTRSISHGM
ncbi:MAG: sigma-70 family RNA polymerase sigma factor [Candidatus Hydrogenedentes bacterium]|nr:sigma-70 family RNA polymerase sigma factor [Candidatus Hydrogenedentota bacterium]